MKTFSRALLALAALSAGACDPEVTSEDRELKIVKSGTGGGTVTANGISCGTDCSEIYADGTSVTLTAEADGTSNFTAWTGCDSSSGTSCTVTMDGDKTVTASFTARTTERLLSVQKAGTGSGMVTGTGISCGADCTEMFAGAASVTLIATPDSGSTVANWTGCDSVDGNECTVNMIQNRTVTVTFTSMEVILVSDDITTPTTWLTGKVYQVTLDVDVKSTLTIQPGVIVRFDDEGWLDVTGTLNVDGGSPQTRVVFTTSKSTPAGGDWRGIRLIGQGSTLHHCAILYAGANDHPALEIDDHTAASITNCVFAHHKPPTDAIDAPPALDASKAEAGTVIRDNLFYDNRVPLSVSTTFSVEANVFDNSAAAPASPQPNKYNGVIVQGCSRVTSNINWALLPVPYVIGDPVTACNYLTVETGGTLTIGVAQNNAVVKLFPHGQITVNGTLVPHAVFTSIADDQLGDTNGNGNATSPAPGDWRGVHVNRTGLIFDRISFLYAGDDDAAALAVGTGAAITVTRSTFAHNKPSVDSIRAAPALDASDSAAGTVIQENVFYDNTVPLSINTASSIDDSNTFTGGMPAVGNKYQAIVMAGCGHVTRAISWGAVKVPLVIGDPVTACNYVTVDAAGQLTIADGAVIKLFNGGNFSAAGTITALGTTGRITFTSFKDDAYGGDTNADAAATTPAGGDWSGINLNASGSRFAKCNFLYAGDAAKGGDDPAIYVAGGKSVSVTDSVFAHHRPTADNLRAPPALDLSDAAALGTVVTGNRFFDSTIPLAINGSLSLDDSNDFDSGVPAALKPNRYNGVIVAGCSHITSAIQWAVTKVPMVIGDPVTACNYITLDAGGSLALAPNLTMKFFEEGAIFVASGATLAIAPTDWLTSIRDDHVNDTNADASATTPAVGDWNGVKYYHSGSDPTCDQSAYMHYQRPNAAGDCTW